MSRRLDLAATGSHSLDGREIVGMPARFYQRSILGGEACGVWVGGQPLYDIRVYDPAGTLVGVVGPEGSPTEHKYDQLRRVLVGELIRS